MTKKHQQLLYLGIVIQKHYIINTTHQ